MSADAGQVSPVPIEEVHYEQAVREYRYAVSRAQLCLGTALAVLIVMFAFAIVLLRNSG